MTGDGSDIGIERLRILRAARDGRLRQDDAGRYVIDGLDGTYERRPDRRVREKLMRSGLIGWLPVRVGGLVALTPDGRSDLEQLERMP